jgi:hypothetical protein
MLSEFVLAAAAVENATASVGEYDDGFAAYVVVAKVAAATSTSPTATCGRRRRSLGDMILLSVRLRKASATRITRTAFRVVAATFETPA